MDFESDVWYYQRHGYVVWTDRLFALFKKQGMGWFVYCVVSLDGVRGLLKWMPYWLPFIGWARYVKGRRQVKWYATNSLRRYLNEDER